MQPESAPTAPVEAPSAPAEAAPSAEPAQSTEATPVAKQAAPGSLEIGRQVEHREAAIQRLREAREKRDGKAKEPETDEVEAAQEKPAAKVEVPDAKATPAPDKVETKPSGEEPAAAEKAAIEKLRRGALENERKYREADEQLKSTKIELEKISALKEKPLELLKHFGVDFEGLVRKVARGEIKPTTAEDLAVEKTTSEVEKLRQELSELKGEYEKRTHSEALSIQREAMEERIKERAESIPAVSVLPWVVEAAQREFNTRRSQGEEVHFDEVVDGYHKTITSNVRSVVMHEPSFKALLADSEVKNAVLKALGQAQKQKPKPTPASSEGGSSARNGSGAIPQIAAAPGTRQQGMPSPEERRANALAALAKRRGA